MNFALEVMNRMLSDLIGRIGGPMTFRLILQPLMAAYFAVRDGLRDARAGRKPYLHMLFRGDKAERHEALREGLKSTGRIFALAIGMDAIYQIKQLHRFYPVEALEVASTLAFVPYLIIRGSVNRVARWYYARKTSSTR